MLQNICTQTSIQNEIFMKIKDLNAPTQVEKLSSVTNVTCIVYRC